jgi:hypothetical protein
MNGNSTAVIADDRELTQLRAELQSLQVWLMRCEVRASRQLAEDVDPVAVLAELRGALREALEADFADVPSQDDKVYAVELLRRVARRDPPPHRPDAAELLRNVEAKRRSRT